MVQNSGESLLLEEEHCFQLIFAVFKGHGAFNSDVFLAKNDAWDLGIRVVEVDFLSRIRESDLISAFVFHEHWIAFEREGEVIRACECEISVFEAELADGRVVARLLSEELAPFLVLRLVCLSQGRVKRFLLRNRVEECGNSKRKHSFKRMFCVSSVGRPQVERGLREPPAESLQQTPVLEYADGEGHLGGVLPLESPFEHHADEFPHHALICFILRRIRLERL